MARPAAKTRGKFTDEKYMGPEPTVTAETTKCEMIRAYSWFNYFYTGDDAKGFAIAYLKSIKYDRSIISKLSKVDSCYLHNIGWNCRLLHQGNVLPDGVWECVDDKINTLVANVEAGVEEESDGSPKVVVSIQERIASKTSDLIGELAEQIDVFFTGGVVQFNVKQWFLANAIKPQIAKRISDHFKPQYSEIFDAIEGKDAELKEAYRGWKKPALKAMLGFIKSIIEQADTSAVVVPVARKPRKKKEKPAHLLVAKLKFKPEHPELNIKSVPAKDIIHAQQLWVYNTKHRNLTVYNAMGPSGLMVRGSSISGFDEKTSVTKKLRKPEAVIKPLLDGGKIYLRKAMDNIKALQKPATGRVNEECILLRVVK